MIPLLLKSLVLILGAKISNDPTVQKFSNGVLRCIVDKYVQTTRSDVQFYLFTRNNLESPEELLMSETVSSLLSILKSSNDAAQNQNSMGTSRTLEEKSGTSSDGAKGSHGFQQLDFSKSNIKSRWFNILAETKIIIHGFIQSGNEETMLAMKEEYLKKGDFNVIILDWSAKSMHPCYPKVIRSVEEVGKMVAVFLDALAEGGASMGKIHLVGFSLGAHVAGSAGSNVKTGKLKRITGLDAAAPLIGRKPQRRLDREDALLVDLIHTTDFLGQVRSMGHVDFYPNGGKIQPGCKLLSACSHNRAVLLYTESINSPVGFSALPCSSWWRLQQGRCHLTGTASTPQLMGDPCPLNATGRYFLTTNDEPPFAQPPKSYEDFIFKKL